MKAEEAYALSRKYTENTVAGAGAVAGKPCQIQSITDITGGHRITFLWKDNSNVDHTSVMDVMDGKGIKAVAVNSSNHLIITYDDDTIVDAGEIDIHSAVNSVNGKTGNVDLTASDVGALSDSTYEEEIHGVNLLKVTASTQTVSGVTFTVNADETITINGSTATRIIFNVTEPFLLPIGTYLFSGVPNGANPGTNTGHNMFIEEAHIDGSAISYHSLYSGEKEIQVTANTKYMRCHINAWPNSSASNLVMKPMLRKADIEDSTYRPYNPQAMQNQLNAQGVLGAKNLLNPSMTTQTKDGLTFTVNDDNTVTVNGTATANGGFAVLSTRALSFDGCILNGNPSTDNTKVKLIYYDESSGRQFDVPANNGEVTINGTNGDNCRVVISYYNGATVSNLTFKPMIRLASDPDDTYQPYAMTNRELMEKKAGLYTKGDTVQCGVSLVGHVTTGTTKLELTLRGNFDKANISNVSVGTSRLLIRGINGYLKTNNDVELNTILFSDYLKLDNVYIYPQYIDLRISLINDGAFTNVTNNTLIDIQGMTLILS